MKRTLKFISENCVYRDFFFCNFLFKEKKTLIQYQWRYKIIFIAATEVARGSKKTYIEKILILVQGSKVRSPQNIR